MCKLLINKTAIITGAARGIGRCIAQVFAEHGANVIITDIQFSDESLKSIEELNQLGIKARAIQSNAADFNDCEKLINEVSKEFPTIDILVNNAGITRDNIMLRMTEEDWDKVITVNLKSVFNMTKAVQRIMLKQRSGSIINMSSIVGLGGNAGQANYAASKAGIIGFTKSIAKELGSRNIRCNAIAPGFIETEMTAKLPPEVRENWIKDIPLGRPGSVYDVANLALFLASDLSSYITGQTITVCGGLHI
ncbi:MAG: 3-oxoacyl-[acyl-carrier-protein] reductase [Bacteroidales bacterium]|nr:3-oxoacyl-[acyl-carrier-protein] reductase [Bacteroidales bacterium]